MKSKMGNAYAGGAIEKKIERQVATSWVGFLPNKFPQGSHYFEGRT
jgi:hypothetical protein